MCCVSQNIIISTLSFVTGREREMFYLTTHSTHFIYGYMASDIWLRTILIVRKETCCRHIGYSYRLTARVLFYPTYRITHTTAFVTPVVEHWLERKIAQWVFCNCVLCPRVANTSCNSLSSIVHSGTLEYM